MEFCQHILEFGLDYYLHMLEKIQKQVYCATGLTFADCLALYKIIVIWSVLVIVIDTLLDAHLSQLDNI